ncbi:MAG: phosphoribosylglycinamide formyltransferase [Gammaproteobacteria bacterium]|nr:MAG: phosphoribosylglycinamide formyltransferase [Gammaproteobacteria bacterium]
MSADKPNIVVLISGSGTNLQAIIDYVANGAIPANIAAVISNIPNVKGLERAQKAGITTSVISHKEFASRDQFDAELTLKIDSFNPDLVILAGFMRILGDDFVNHYQGKMLNIHPSLLPKFTGLHTHKRALEAGETNHGTSVHFVTSELDGGPVIIQATVTVLPDDSEESLAQRVLVQEHRIYPLVTKWFIEGRLKFDIAGNQITYDGSKLESIIKIDADTPVGKMLDWLPKLKT